MNVKRFTAMALCIASLLTFAGCGDKANNKKEDTKSNNAEIVKNEEQKTKDDIKPEAGLVNAVEKNSDWRRF